MPSTSFVSGEELENELVVPPYAYYYGTICTVLAVLMRSGCLAIKSNTGNPIYNYKDEEAWNVFSKSRDFKKAAFKLITSSLSLAQKQELVDNLKKIKTAQILNKDFNYTTNNIELVSLIADLARHFSERIEEREKMIDHFETYFPQFEEKVNVLKPFNTKITDANYKDKAEEFLISFADIEDAVKNIKDILKFIENNLKQAERFKEFVNHIVIELGKLDIKYHNNPVFSLQKDFENKFSVSLMQNYSELKKIYQNVKDEYFGLIKSEHSLMTKHHGELKESAEKQRKKIYSISPDQNKELIAELDDLIRYADSHICNQLKIEYEIACQTCHFTLNEIIVSNQSFRLKLAANEQTEYKIKYPQKPGEVKEPRRINMKLTKGEFTVSQYKVILNEKLDQVNKLNDDDIIVVD